MVKDSRLPASSLDGQSSARPSWWRSTFQNNIVAVILAMILLVPLVTGTALLTSAGKLITFEVLGGVLLLLVLSQISLRNPGERLKKIVLAGPNLPILLLVGFAAISCAYSPFKSFSSAEFLRIGFCALLYFTV